MRKIICGTYLNVPNIVLWNEKYIWELCLHPIDYPQIKSTCFRKQKIGGNIHVNQTINVIYRRTYINRFRIWYYGDNQKKLWIYLVSLCTLQPNVQRHSNQYRSVINIPTLSGMKMDRESYTRWSPNLVCDNIYIRHRSGTNVLLLYPSNKEQHFQYHTIWKLLM